MSSGQPADWADNERIYYEALAKWLRGARRRANLTQRQAATFLGVSVSTIQSYEQGQRAIPAYSLALLRWRYVGDDTLP